MENVTAIDSISSAGSSIGASVGGSVGGTVGSAVVAFAEDVFAVDDGAPLCGVEDAGSAAVDVGAADDVGAAVVVCGTGSPKTRMYETELDPIC